MKYFAICDGRWSGLVDTVREAADFYANTLGGPLRSSDKTKISAELEGRTTILTADNKDHSYLGLTYGGLYALKG